VREVEREGPKATWSAATLGAPGGSAGTCRRSTALMRATQLARVEGLRDVVVRARLQARDAVDVVAARGEHHDADRGVVARSRRQIANRPRRAASGRAPEVVAGSRQVAVHGGRVGNGVDGEALLVR
jgi:hypothetical protein